MTSPADRGGSAPKPRPGLGVERSPLERAGALPGELQTRLLPQARERGRRDPGHDGAGRCLGQRGQGVDAAGEEPLHLGALDAGHPHDVVLPLELVLARLAVVAERAVMAGVGAGHGPSAHGRAEAPAHATEVCGHVGQPDRDALTSSEDDVGQIWRQLLRVRQGAAVEGELQRVLGPGRRASLVSSTW